MISAMLVWVMIRYRGESHEFARQRIPEFTHCPSGRPESSTTCSGAILGLIVPGVLFFRFHSDGSSGWGAVYGYPDANM